MDSEDEEKDELKNSELIKKLLRWFDNRDNLLLFLVLLIALAVRIYFFNLTLNQPVWWDEGEYGSMANAIAHNLDYNFLIVRPILFPFLMGLLFKLHYSELLPRLMIFAFSIGSVYGIYLLGKEFYNKKVGLIASFLFSFSYLVLFYTFRLLVEVPSLFFFIYSGLFIVKYLKNSKSKHIYIAAALAGVGTMFKLPTASVLLATAIYLLITEKVYFLKKKELWVALLIYFIALSPYIIWGFFEFHDFVITGAAGWNAPTGSRFENFFDNLFGTGGELMGSYFSMLKSIYSIPVLLFLLIGFLLMYPTFLKFDLILKNKKNPFYRDLFLILMFLTPIFLAAFAVNYADDRLIIDSIAPGFLIASFGIFSIYSYLSKMNKNISYVFLLITLLVCVYLVAITSNNIIIAKKTSFEDFKIMGEWLRDNTQENEIIVGAGWPMIQFYSQRETIGPPQTKEEFLELKNKTPEMKYFVLSAYQKTPEWSYAYPIENNLTPINGYVAPGTNSALLVIYHL